MPPFLLAICISLAGVFLLDCMGAIIKHLGDAYPPQQMSMFRNMLGLVPSAILLFSSRDWHAAGRPWRLPNWPLALLRGLTSAFAQFCFYTSLAHIAFATASTLAFSGPLFVTALSVPMLRERVGIWRWTAVVIGFLGVIWIMRPGAEVFSWYAVLPVLAAAGYATSTVIIKLFPPQANSGAINIYSQASAMTCAGLFTAVSTGFVPIASLVDLTWILAMGLGGGSGVLCLVVAYRMTRPSTLAPFDYFGIIFAFGLGWTFFSEAPFEQLFPGVLLIVAGGLIIIWRERRREGS